MKKRIQAASIFAAVVAVALIPATVAVAGGSRGKKAEANGANSSHMRRQTMRLGGPRSNNGRAPMTGRPFDRANTGYGEYGSIAFANGEQRFDGVSVRQFFLKRSQDGSGG